MKTNQETFGICERCQTSVATRFVMNESRCQPCLDLDDKENGDPRSDVDVMRKSIGLCYVTASNLRT